MPESETDLAGSRPASVANLRFLGGGGEMGQMMRGFDWSTTPFGAPEGWSQSLRAAISIMLNSRYPIALYWGPHLALLYNEAWSPILGSKHPWALGKPGREVWPEIWETIGPLYARVLSTGEGIWQEDELLPMLRHGYLEECYYNFTFSPVRGETGSIDGIFNAVIETTDRVISERRLRTLSRMGERTDSALTVEGACRWVADILGENRKDVPFALIYLRDGESFQLAAATGIEVGTAAAPRTILPTAEGPRAWPLAAAQQQRTTVCASAPAGLDLPPSVWQEPITQVVIVPIAAPGEPEPTAILVAGLNPRRRFDAAYQSFVELAAGHVGTAISTARAYEEERKRADALAALDQAKTTFFANISHEFRTPLTLMLAPLEELLAKPEGEVVQANRTLVDLAHRNGLRLLRLVNALLDFSRIEAGRVQAVYQPTDLSDFTAELASSFRSATDKAGLSLDLDLPELSQPVFVDRDMWEKIVLNLMSNAFKFTLNGGIKVTLHETNEEAQLTVADTGVGISESELPRVFERFHRAEDVQGRSHEGSGIGLALVYELVKLHGGHITVESTVGVGTRFIVGVPLGTQHLAADRIRTPNESPASSARARAFVDEALRWLPASIAQAMTSSAGPVGGDPLSPQQTGGPRARILLADDNQDMSDYVRRLLAEHWDVEVVRDGVSALTAVRLQRPDLILSDVMMPQLDGLGLLAAIRGDPGLRSLPVILLSARAGEEAGLEGLNAGADDYLVKPFSAQELVARVRTHLELSQVRTAAEAQERELRAAAERDKGQMRILLDELNHRVKNNLAAVQAVAMETLRNSTSLSNFGEKFNARLTALARAHDLLTQESWSAVSLEDLVAQTLRPYSNTDEIRVEFGGDNIRLSPTAALSLNMAFHELATNAAKYGALTVPDGKVRVRWRTGAGDRLIIEWAESGGPAVQRPSRRGFGSRLIERSAKMELGGVASMEFEATGLVCRIDVPLSGKVMRA